MAADDPVSLVADAYGFADLEVFAWLKGEAVPEPTLPQLVNLVARGPAASRRGRANTIEATDWMLSTHGMFEAGHAPQVPTQDLLDLVFCMWRHGLPRHKIDLVDAELRRRVRDRQASRREGRP